MESLGKGPGNLEENSGARLPNAPKSLEGGDVGLNSNSKCLSSWTP